MAKVNSVGELINQFYGIETAPRVNRQTSSVGTTATKLVNNNPKRVYLTMVNLGSNDVFLMIDNLVASDRGIYLSPNGGSFTLRWIDDFNLLENEWYGIAIAAASDILILEGEIL